ncbi:MAG: hypothetical protein J6O40_06080 [Ruminococcus sp.]|nr:hypothetical protein [Ruminococcus sp.]
MQRSLDSFDIISSLISSFVIGILSVIFTANLFADGISLSSVIAGLAYSAVSFALVFYEYIGVFKLKAAFSLAAVPLFSIFAIMLGIYDFAFERANRDYVREYGGANQGDIMGLMYLHIPAAVSILAVVTAIAYSLKNKEISDNSKEGKK